MIPDQVEEKIGHLDLKTRCTGGCNMQRCWDDGTGEFRGTAFVCGYCIRKQSGHVWPTHQELLDFLHDEGEIKRLREENEAMRTLLADMMTIQAESCKAPERAAA